MIVYKLLYYKIENQEIAVYDNKCKQCENEIQVIKKKLVHMEYNHNKIMDEVEELVEKYCNANEKAKFKTYYYN